MKWNLLAAVALPFALVFAGCAAETSDSTDPNANAAEDPTDETTDDLTQKLQYSDVESIIDSTCGGCHSQFKSLAGIKSDKKRMKSMIKAGAMPKGDPTWKTTADGKKVVKWLTSGADLK